MQRNNTKENLKLCVYGNNFDTHAFFIQNFFNQNISTDRRIKDDKDQKATLFYIDKNHAYPVPARHRH